MDISDASVSKCFFLVEPILHEVGPALAVVWRVVVDEGGGCVVVCCACLTCTVSVRVQTVTSFVCVVLSSTARHDDQLTRQHKNTVKS